MLPTVNSHQNSRAIHSNPEEAYCFPANLFAIDQIKMIPIVSLPSSPGATHFNPKRLSPLSKIRCFQRSTSTRLQELRHCDPEAGNCSSISVFDRIKMIPIDSFLSSSGATRYNPKGLNSFSLECFQESACCRVQELHPKGLNSLNIYINRRVVFLD